MSWEIKKLSDCCISIADGDHQAPPKSDSGVPFVTISNINASNQFDFTNTMFVPQEYYDGLDSKRKAQKGDILYSVVGSFGIPVYMKETVPFVFQRHIAILRPNDTILPQFLYYTMLSRDFYMQADAAALGAAQRTISLSALRNMKIAVPPLDEQQKIVANLSAFDDLIENNQKQINLLEEAAQRLYKEWFVDLRFPGHETTSVVDGVPEGWHKGKISDFVPTSSGGTPSRTHPEYYSNGTNLWVKTQELNDGFIFDTEEKITDDAIKNSSAKIIPQGSILMAMYGATIGKIGIAATELTCNQACCVFNLSKIKYATSYLYCWLKDNRDFFVSQGKGAAQPNLSQAMIKNFDVLIPTADILTTFSQVTDTLLELSAKLHLQNRDLIEARDRLLPKLMSGEIEV